MQINPVGNSPLFSFFTKKEGDGYLSKQIDALPKTRCGKIMQRLLGNQAAGQEVSGDTSTLEDRGVLDKLRQGA